MSPKITWIQGFWFPQKYKDQLHHIALNLCNMLSDDEPGHIAKHHHNRFATCTYTSN